jgi:hypothetical protein
MEGRSPTRYVGIVLCRSQQSLTILVAELIRITPAEIAHARQVLQDYPEAQAGLAVLEKHQGNPKTSVEELLPARSATVRLAVSPQRSVWEILLEQLYLELCGEEEDSFREMVKEAKRNPDSSPLLTGLIVYLVDLANISLNPAIATIIVLYILKLGVSTFCDYTAQFRRSRTEIVEGLA